ncbi:MAG: cupin domain-containing protein [Armatimonadetes bacterium]|nr:cupin domain-containing protein [Armatimonadota bacterium]
MAKRKTTATERLLGKVFKAADLVQYQDAAIVSRAIVDKKAGTVTAFAFDEGEGLSEHTAPYDALVYVLEGQLEVAIAGEQMVLSEGDLVIMPANKPHAVRAVTRCKMLLVMIREKISR